MKRALSIAGVLICPIIASAHYTGIPHLELTPEQLRQLAQAAQADPTQYNAQSLGFEFQQDFTTTLFQWVLDPWIWLTLLLSGGLYAVGVRRFWKVAHVGAVITWHNVAWYALGWFSLVIALASPIHTWGEVLFSVHMVQHEILMLISAPLMVLGRPVIAFLWSFPRPWRRAVGRFSATSSGNGIIHFLSNPFWAWLIHAVCLWIWHLPVLFEATLTSELVHTLQHASFFGSALLFWWALIYGPRRAMGYGMAVVYLFTTAVHSGILGALLIFSRQLWYPVYAATTLSWGASPLEDQQLGGLYMWVPAGVVYIIAGLIFFVGALRESDKKNKPDNWLQPEPGPAALAEIRP